MIEDDVLRAIKRAEETVYAVTDDEDLRRRVPLLESLAAVRRAVNGQGERWTVND